MLKTFIMHYLQMNITVLQMNINVLHLYKFEQDSYCYSR